MTNKITNINLTKSLQGTKQQAIVLMAAGQGSRFGGIKQLASLNDGSSSINVLQYQLKKLVSFNLPIYIVIGAHNTVINTELDKLDNTALITILYHKDWQQGLGSSIAFACQYLDKKYNYSHIVLLLLDQVLVTVSDIQRLLNQSQSNPDDVICSQYQEQIGVPAIFPQDQLSALSQLTGDKGAKHLLQQNKKKHLVPLANASWDIDTPQQLIEIRKQLDWF